MTQTTTASIAAIGRVTVPVSDQDRAIEFYVAKLGFEKRADIPYGNGERWVEVAPPGARTGIALTLPMEGQAAGSGSGLGLTTNDLEALHAELRSRGVEVDEIQRMGDPVPPMFFLRDPDGTALFVTQE